MNKQITSLSAIVAAVVTVPFVLSGCASLHYERHEPDGTVVVADLTEFATDASLEGFKYETSSERGRIFLSVDGRNQLQSAAFGAAVEAALRAALKSIVP